MSYFLWIEDFENSPKVTASEVLGGLGLDAGQWSDDKWQLKRHLKNHGIFVELSLQDGLAFIKTTLSQIDYVILDIDLVPYYEDDEINDSLYSLLTKFHDYQPSQDLKHECGKLKATAGYYLYTELLVEQGFPKQHVLFCSNHGENTTETQAAFKSAKIDLSTIYKKADSDVKKWVKERYDNPYSRLRRGIIEACQYAKNLSVDSLYFNRYTVNNDSIQPEDIFNYLEIIENFLPLSEPVNKANHYKLFIRTLSHEWEAAKNIKRDNNKKDAVLARIMRNTRHWITHNPKLFDSINEKLVAYLFIVNLRVMFDFDDKLQRHEEILLKLFEEEALTGDQFKGKSIPVSDAYLELKNIVLDEKHNNQNIEDAFYFNEIANNIQLSNSSVRDDKQLFVKLLYQMFWLTTSNPFISAGNRKNLLEIKFWNFDYAEKPYLFELAGHIYTRSFS